MADFKEIVKKVSKKKGIEPDAIHDLINIAREYPGKDVSEKRSRKLKVSDYIDENTGDSSEN